MNGHQLRRYRRRCVREQRVAMRRYRLAVKRGLVDPDHWDDPLWVRVLVTDPGMNPWCVCSLTECLRQRRDTAVAEIARLEQEGVLP